MTAFAMLNDTYYTNTINWKVCEDGCMYGYLLLFHERTTERMGMKFGTEVD